MKEKKRLMEFFFKNYILYFTNKAKQKKCRSTSQLASIEHLMTSISRIYFLEDATSSYWPIIHETSACRIAADKAWKTTF